MISIDDLDHLAVLCVISNRGISFFNERAGDKLPCPLQWQLRFVICLCGRRRIAG